MVFKERKSIRLKNYDYSNNGYYFITICTENRKRLLCRGEQCSPGCNTFELSETGKLIVNSITNISKYYTSVRIDKYVVMPNHVHMIIVLQGDLNGRTLFAPTVSRIVKHLKEYITKQVGYSVWQKSYYDHIIRTESDYQEIWQYIDTNPLRWELDDYYNS